MGIPVNMTIPARKKTILVWILLTIAPVLHAQSWSTLNADMAVPMDTSTPGSTLTTAIANAGTVSSTCTVSTSCGFNSGGVAMTVGANVAA